MTGTSFDAEPLLLGLPEDKGLLLELIGLHPHPVHKVPTFYFRVLEAKCREEVGTINLRIGSGAHLERYAGHIGYSVNPAHRGNRYAARSLRILLPFAREHGIEPVWVTCDQKNLASRRSCELAGAVFAGIVDVPADCIINRSGHPQKCRYVLNLADEVS